MASTNAANSLQTTAANGRVNATSKAATKSAQEQGPSIGQRFSDSLGLTSVKKAVDSVESTGKTILSKGISELKSIVDSVMAAFGFTMLLDDSHAEDRARQKKEAQQMELANWQARRDEDAARRKAEFQKSLATA